MLDPVGFMLVSGLENPNQSLPHLLWVKLFIYQMAISKLMFWMFHKINLVQYYPISCTV